jgi:hypothetical protein
MTQYDTAAPLTGFGDDTNSSIKFGLLFPEGRYPDWTGGPRLAQFSIPHSDRTTTQYLGRDPWTITLHCYFPTLTNLELLDGVQGARQTLRIKAGLTRTAGGTIETLQDVQYLILPETLLLSISNSMIDLNGFAEADVTFQRPATASTYSGFMA